MTGKFHTKMVLLSCCLSVCLISCQARAFYPSEGHKFYGKSPLPYDLSAEASYPSFSYAYAPRPQPPMQLTGNYNLIMPDYYDHHPAESMQLQNFANFHEAHIDSGSDLGMDESQHGVFLHQSTPVRAPQPLSADERRIRQHVQPVDPKREKKALLKLKKGNTQPRGEGYQQWDQFDYDLYSVNPADNKKHNYYG